MWRVFFWELDHILNIDSAWSSCCTPLNHAWIDSTCAFSSPSRVQLKIDVSLDHGRIGFLCDKYIQLDMSFNILFYVFTKQINGDNRQVTSQKWKTWIMHICSEYVPVHCQSCDRRQDQNDWVGSWDLTPLGSNATAETQGWVMFLLQFHGMLGARASL